MTVSNHGFMFGVGIVDTAGAAMSEAREWLRGTPASATITLSTTQRERKRCGNRPGNRISPGANRQPVRTFYVLSQIGQFLDCVVDESH